MVNNMNSKSQTVEFREKWISPFYLGFLGANFIEYDNDMLQEFANAIDKTIPKCNIALIEELLQGDWRSRLVGSWFAGIHKYDQLVDNIGKLLLDSEFTYAGQGYCFAILCFKTNPAKDYLVKYLKKYLPLWQKNYDQVWAFATYQVLENKLEDKIMQLWGTYENEITSSKMQLAELKNRINKSIEFFESRMWK